MLSGVRRVKEADALDITDYSRDPGNSYGFHKLTPIWGAPVSSWKREQEKHEIPERLAHPDATAFLRRASQPLKKGRVFEDDRVSRKRIG